MKPKTPASRYAFAAVVVLGIGLHGSLCEATRYAVTIDTTVLAAQTTPPAPFALEFQFIDGDPAANNAATLSGFDFGAGGARSGSPIYNCTSGSAKACGGVSGDLAATVALNDGSDFFNEFVQPFTASPTDPLRFVLDLTTNLGTGVPDAFSLAILDASGTGLPTDFFDVFIQIDLMSPPTIATYASDSAQLPPGCSTCPAIAIPAPDVRLLTVPEPGTLLLLLVVGLAASAKNWLSARWQGGALPRTA